jgi:hypothetical protein
MSRLLSQPETAGAADGPAWGRRPLPRQPESGLSAALLAGR